ncbi:hypothetical protein OSCT_1806 [Oscillochloris trichoides DG-6]|uniref:GIY-YIG domain-containing protein n=1 Tax=Oscillochloris trichoides DG-6 TaxID=765420 RepID=E1IEQ5_9CHLR|nr:GIY-YIG nuclease family protein [Oscillochloris trichoides]EFO80347.1 hypothetical protein OSCT_1806 [Oscillochloris trichoides DG-6]
MGSYILLLHLMATLTDLQLGRLGRYTFAPGYYLYVGSAFGPGGLSARLRHHERRDKPRLHWHIDYLRAHTDLLAIWAVTSPQRLECHWCAACRQHPRLSIPVLGFGASDTSCRSHLFYLPAAPSDDLLAEIILAPCMSLGLEEIRLDVFYP